MASVSSRLTAHREDTLRVARVLADLLDRRVPLPGLGLPVGLDPLIGLIPGIGDLLAGALGALILVIAAQHHVPKIVLVRMSLNTAINGAIGAIPLLGDLFSFWFKSNVRNVALLERYAAAARPSTLADWAFVIGLLGLVLAFFVLVVTGLVALIKAVWVRV